MPNEEVKIPETINALEALKLADDELSIESEGEFRKLKGRGWETGWFCYMERAIESAERQICSRYSADYSR